MKAERGNGDWDCVRADVRACYCSFGIAAGAYEFSETTAKCECKVLPVGPLACASPAVVVAHGASVAERLEYGAAVKQARAEQC